MPRLEFERSDTTLVITPVAREPGLFEVSQAGVQVERLPLGPLSEAMRLALCAAPRRLKGQAGLRLARLALDIRTPALQAHPWEQWLVPQSKPARFDAVVRVSPVLARVAQATFTPPLRVLVCDAPEPQRLLDGVRSVFGARERKRDARVAKAYTGAAMPSQELSGAEAVPQGWPVVDVLHLAHFPIAASAEAQLSPDAGERGSLGWLARALHAWQTRLLIIDGAGPRQAALARQLAAALVARAGPAVIVRDGAEPTLPLYDRLIHDMPLDALTGRHQFTGLPVPRIESLFVGGGREEIVRVSATVVALREMQHTLARSRIHFTRPDELPTGPAAALPPLLRGIDNDARAASRIERVVKDYEGWAFNFSEADGFIPMSESLAQVREAVGGLVRASGTRTRRRKPRHVNASLWKPGAERVDPDDEWLEVGSPYRLGIQIGPRDRLVPVYEASPFKEIPRIHGQKGVWLEVAVNGLGFDVEGDSVQDLWLSFDEPSDELWFAVRPVREGVAVLRYTLHHRQNVVQSFRLAAITRAPRARADEVDLLACRLRLATALHVVPHKLPHSTWVTKLDYEAASIAQAATLPERRLAIVANHTLDERWITVKGLKYQFDNKPGGVNSLVTATRDQLFEGSVDKIKPARQDWVNRFGANVAVNERNLRKVLPKLALAGWRMYDSVFSAADRRAMQEDLTSAGAMITVAHALLQDVVPWALMYDRPFFGKPGTRLDVCTAALPTADGSMPVKSCRESAQCLLHQGLRESNVACPLHFWGFRHLIEIPPKQGNRAKADPLASPTPAPSMPSPAAPVAVRLAAVMNASLHTAAAHEARLRALKTLKGEAVNWQQIEMGPDDLLSALADPALDLVYLYCHARGGVGDPEKTDPPLLEFSDKHKTTTYTADEFQLVWQHRPLVIVNGCSTAAFTPDALSPFVQKFCRDCEAGGVIGTEIPVHEWLATDFAQRLLAHVLDREPVGQALLCVRRELLAQNNPLGLAYTFYGFSELEVGKGDRRG